MLRKFLTEEQRRDLDDECRRYAAYRHSLRNNEEDLSRFHGGENENSNENSNGIPTLNSNINNNDKNQNLGKKGTCLVYKR